MNTEFQILLLNFQCITKCLVPYVKLNMYINKYRHHTVITYLVSQQHGMSVVEKCT